MKIVLNEDLEAEIKTYLDTSFFKNYFFENLVYLLLTGYLPELHNEQIDKSMKYHIEKDKMDELSALAMGKVNGIISDNDPEHDYKGFVDFSFYDIIKNNIKIIDKSFFDNNPYLKKFIKYFEENDCLNKEFFIELLEIDEKDIDIYETEILKYGLFVPKVCIFKDKVAIPTKIVDDEYADKLGMYEITEFNKHIDKAHGKVLCFGMHFGYFPYMAALKDNVEKVTIVLNNKSEIDFLKNHIFKDFEYSDKIEIINKSEISYIKDIKDGDFDYIFVSNYDILDTLEMYLKMKRLLASFNKSEVGFWFDNFFANTCLDLFFPVFYAEYLEKDTLDSGQYEDIEYIFRNELKYIRKLFKNIKEINADNFLEILSYENMLKMLKETK